jgi:60S ribosome subunit biogenesis protein NIP7
MRLGISVARPNLVSLGTCFGKFSKSGKFKLHITALDHLAQYAKYKVCWTVFQFSPPSATESHTVRLQVWIKPNGEMPFLYGNHVLKAHLGRITEDTPEHQGVVVYSMNDMPLVRTTQINPPGQPFYTTVAPVISGSDLYPVLSIGLWGNGTINS